jgi:hypothetical protein
LAPILLLLIATSAVQSPLPDWVQYWAALGPTIAAGTTALIGVFLAIVAWRQWRTARERLVLDLFRDRLAVYSKVIEAMHRVIGPGRAVDNEPYLLLHAARDEAQFLFRREVPEYIEGLLIHVANLGLAHNMMEAQRNGNPPDGTDYPKLSYDSMMAVISVPNAFPALLSRYLNMSQTLPGKAGSRRGLNDTISRIKAKLAKRKKNPPL